ncbi:MAG: PelD GGDEF domain-containing protein [Telluria sp.]
MTPAEARAIQSRLRWIPARARDIATLEVLTLGLIIPATLLQFLNPRLAVALVPMLTFIPVLLGGRYGFFAGLVSALLLAAVMFEAFYFQPQTLNHFPKLQAVVYLLAGSIAGQFRDHWAARLDGMQSSANLDRIRLAQFTSTFHLLKASHAQLERHLAGNTTSVRTSIQWLKSHLPTSPAEAGQPLGGIGKPLLELLAETCNLHAAAVYAISERGMIAPAPAAVIGAATHLSPFNPLLREALCTGNVVSIRANDTGVEQLVAIVPLIDSLGHIHGVVSVNQMLFVSIHQRTFDLMAIIARQIGDILASRIGTLTDASNNQALLNCLERCLANARLNRMPLAVVASKVVDSTKANQLVAHCLDVHRGIDQSWLCHDHLGQPVIVVLLPMADESAARSQVERVREHVAKQHGSVVASEGIKSFVLMANGDRRADEVLAMILLTCDIQLPISQSLTGASFKEVRS